MVPLLSHRWDKEQHCSPAGSLQMDRGCKEWAILAWGIGLGCKEWAALACGIGLALVPIDAQCFCPHCHHPGLSEGIHFCIPKNRCQATAGPTLGFEKGTKGK